LTDTKFGEVKLQLRWVDPKSYHVTQIRRADMKEACLVGSSLCNV